MTKKRLEEEIFFSRITSKIKEYRTELGFFLIYVLLSLFVTYPLVLYMRTSAYGFMNDNYGTIWSFWWLKYAFVNHVSSAHSPFLSAPFGMNFGAIPIQPYERYLGLLFTLLVDEVFAYNFLILSSFTVSGITMYFLAYHITGNKQASFIAGLVYAFAPFHLAMTMQYIPLGSIQWIPLFALCLIRLREKPTVLNAVWAGLSYALVFISAYYYGVYSAVLLAVFIVFAVVYNTAKKKGVFTSENMKAAVIFLVVALAVIIPMTFRFIGNTGATAKTYARPLNETIRYSIRPWSFVLPTLDNPVFGRFTSGFIQNHLYDCPVSEQSLYLGIIPIGLAVYCLMRVRREKDDKRVFGVWFSVLLGLVALLFAIGPYIPLDPVNYYPRYMDVSKIPKIPSVSLLLYKVAPMFRFFSRFDVLIVLSLAVLSGVGAAYLFERIKDKKIVAGSVLAVMALLIFIEYANVPPFHNVDLSKPPKVYTWLAAQKPEDAIVVEYPYDMTMSPRSLYYSFYQRIHKKRLVNFAFGDKAQSTREKIKNISDPNTPAVLRSLGVDYVIVHTKLPPRTYPPYQPVLPDDSIPDPGIQSGYGLALVKKFDDALVYKVVKPERMFTGVTLSPSTGFEQAERWPDGKDWRWMDDRSRITAVNYGNNPASFDLTFDAISFGKDRELKVLVNGVRVADEKITTQKSSYTLHGVLIAEGTSTILFDTEPGPVKIDSVLHNGDMRKVTIAMSDAETGPAAAGETVPLLWLEPVSDI